MEYLATVRSVNGTQTRVRVTSADRRGAAKELSLSPSRVLNVKPNLIGYLLSKDLSSGPSKSEQAVLLHNLAAQLGGKRSTKDIFDKYLEHDSRFKMDPAKESRALEVEDFLDALGFERNVVLLAEAGRKAGNIQGALKEAAEYLLEEEERKGAVFKRIMSGVMYSGAAVGMAIFGSMGFAGQLREIESNLGAALAYNTATEILFALDSFFKNYGMLVGLLLGLCFVFRTELFNIARTWPFLAKIDRIQRIQRGITFLSTFAILRRASFTDKAAVEYIAKNAEKRDKVIFNKLASVKEKGDRLHKGLEKSEWSPSILSGLGQLEELNLNEVLDMIKAILQGQRRELTKAAENLANTMQFFGMVSLVLILLTCIVGFLLPVISATASPV